MSQSAVALTKHMCLQQCFRMFVTDVKLIQFEILVGLLDLSYAYPALATPDPDPLTDTFPRTLTETHKAVNKIKTDKAPGLCGVYPDYILHGGPEGLRILHHIFTRVWEVKVIPQEKGKRCRLLQLLLISINYHRPGQCVMNRCS